MPGLDLLTLQQNAESAPVLNSLANPSSCIYMHNKSKDTYLSMFSVPKSNKKLRVTLEDHLISPSELLENNYAFEESFKKSSKKAADDELKIIGLDCEMVQCADGAQLARVTVIDKNFNPVYDEFIKPPSEILDYLTQFSGITEEIMKIAVVTAEEAQEKVLQLLGEDTIICGHSLENDLLQLKIDHRRIIDTSLIYPHPVPGYKHSLKTLSQKFLKKRIQQVISNQGSHDSIEDASAALELVYAKLENGPNFGNFSQSQENSLIPELEKEGKKVKILEYDENFLQLVKNGNGLVLTAWKEIEKDQDFEAREENIKGILNEWDRRLKEVCEVISKDTGVVIVSGIGDVGLAE